MGQDQSGRRKRQGTSFCPALPLLLGPEHCSVEASCRADSQVYADATLVFPLIVAATFGKAHWAAQAEDQADTEAGSQA